MSTSGGRRGAVMSKWAAERAVPTASGDCADQVLVDLVVALVERGPAETAEFLLWAAFFRGNVEALEDALDTWLAPGRVIN